LAFPFQGSKNIRSAESQFQVLIFQNVQYVFFLSRLPGRSSVADDYFNCLLTFRQPLLPFWNDCSPGVAVADSK